MDGVVGGTENGFERTQAFYSLGSEGWSSVSKSPKRPTEASNLREEAFLVSLRITRAS
jgi:hypothetical protein